MNEYAIRTSVSGNRLQSQKYAFAPRRSALNENRVIQTGKRGCGCFLLTSPNSDIDLVNLGMAGKCCKTVPQHGFAA